MTAETRLQNPALGITFVLIAILAISVNDMLIKLLSGGYPLHQMVFTRSIIGICFTFVLVHIEGGWSNLRTATPGLSRPITTSTPSRCPRSGRARPHALKAMRRTRAGCG